MGAFKLAQNIESYLKFMAHVKSASPLTLKHYRLDLNQAFAFEASPRTLSESELLSTARAAFNQWAPLSLASRNRKAATLKSFFSWAFDEQLTEKDLSFQITCPKVPKKIPHFLSVDEILAVLKGLEQEDKTLLRDRVLFLLIYGGGLRVSEACAMKWTDLQWSQKTLRILGKGNKERLVALPALAWQVLKKWQKEFGSEDYIFGATAMNPRTAYEIIRQCGRRAGLLKPLHPHALRHSFATHLLSSGANLRVLQELLGHESLQATEKYTHLGIDHLARTMESLHPLGKKDRVS